MQKIKFSKNTGTSRFNESQDVGLVFCGLTIPVLFVLAIILQWICPLIVSPVDLSVLNKDIREGVICEPKPLEQLRFIVAIAFIPLSYLGIFLGFQELKKRDIFRIFTNRSWILLTQLLLIGIVGWAYIQQHVEVYRYFRPPQLRVTVLLALVLWFGFYKETGSRPFLKKFWTHLRSKWIPKVSRDIQSGLTSQLSAQIVSWFIAFIFCVYTVLPGIANKENLGRANGTLTYHLPFFMGEIFSSASQKFPYVNFYPQYQNFLSILLTPVYKCFGYTISSFTLSMVSLSVLGLLAVYACFIGVVRSPAKALLLFIPVVAATAYRVDETGAPCFATSMLYYANWPIRLFGPSLLFYGISRYFLHKHSAVRQWVVFYLASWVAMNNFDFGIPAFVGAWAAVSIFGVLQGGRLHFRRLVQSLVLGVSALLAAVFSYEILIYVLSGRFPDLTKAVDFQFVFAKYGFGNIPAPKIGFHWIIYGTFMYSIVQSLIILGRNPNPSQNQMLRAGLLLYNGVFGAGSMMYFMGRSHPFSLIVFFYSWAISLVLLINEFLIHFSNSSSITTTTRNPSSRIRIIPSIGYAFFYSLLITTFFYRAPSIYAEVSRIASAENPFDPFFGRVKIFLKSYVHPHQSIGLVIPFSEMIAEELDVINTYPFAHSGSIFLLSQLDTAIDEIRRTHTTLVFGEFFREFRERLEKEHFVRIAQFEIYELWAYQPKNAE